MYRTAAKRTHRAKWALSTGLLFCLVVVSGTIFAVATANAHLGPPRFAGDKQTAYYGGDVQAADRPLQWWFESRWPKADGVVHTNKASLLRADDPWNGLKPNFYADSGYREIHYDAPYRSVREEGRTNFCRDTRDDPQVPGENPRPLNLIYWEPSPTGASGTQKPAEISQCFQGGHLKSFAIVINSSDRWHTKRRWDNMPTDVYDMQSTATHEFGHATGFVRHFNEPLDENTPDEWSAQRARCGARSSKRETMCPGGDTGKAYERTLGPHDFHTFQSVYP